MRSHRVHSNSSVVFDVALHAQQQYFRLKLLSSQCECLKSLRSVANSPSRMITLTDHSSFQDICDYDIAFLSDHHPGA